MAMDRVPLLSGAYQNKSLIANAQRCVNLYLEKNIDPKSPVPVTHYQTPGSALYANAGLARATRCTYRTTIGTAYVVVGPSVYFLASNGALILVGTIADRPSQVIMSDNGLSLVMVDGDEGWAIDLATNNFGQIIDPAFYGASHVTFLDTFYIFNRPDTNQFYISLSMATFAMLTGGTAFDPLDIAAKAGNADNIVALTAVHRELWLIGELTTEVWVGTGAADFYFQLQQGAFIDHGCIAPYSLASMDVFSFWLMQDKQGKCVIVQGGGYQVKEVSTPALVTDFQAYAVVSDAIGFCFQISDHAFYCIVFPTSNITYIYDVRTEQWSQWAWTDPDSGELNRHRANCCMFANGYNLIGDWETGILWRLDAALFVDGDPNDPLIEVPIVHTRTFPHLLGNGERVSYTQFIIDMECGTTTVQPAEGQTNLDVAPQISLRWSDNRGRSYGNAVMQNAGAQGDYIRQISFWRLGMARDRMFEISWSSPFYTTLNGAFVSYEPHET